MERLDNAMSDFYTDPSLTSRCVMVAGGLDPQEPGGRPLPRARFCLARSRFRQESGDALHPSRGLDAPNLVPRELREPDIAIGSWRDVVCRVAAGGRELGDDSAGGDAPNLVLLVPREPDIAVWARRDAGRVSGDGELGDDSAGGDAPNVVHGIFCEPEVAIRARRDVT